MVELRKFLFNFKAIYKLVCGLLIFASITMISRPLIKNGLSEQDLNYHKEYLNYLQGPLDDKKIEFLNIENNKIGDAINQKANAKENLFLGYIDINEYNKLLYDSNRILEKEKAFKLAYKNYDYIYEDIEKRFFISNNSFFEEKINVILYITLLFTIVPLYFTEYETSVYDLLKASKNPLKIAKFKFIISYCWTIICVILFRIIELIAYIKCNQSITLFYPIQSLINYGTSKFNITILQGFILITMFQIIGYLGFISILILMSNTIKYKQFIYFAPLSFLFLSEILINNKTYLYLLPSPYGLMRGSGYIMGDISRNLQYGKEYLFSEIPTLFIILALVSSIVWGLISYYSLVKKYENYQIKYCRKYRIGFLLFLVFILTSCTHGEALRNEDIIYFTNQDLFIQNDKSIIYVDKNILYSLDKNSMEKQNLLQDPFLETKEYLINKVYANKDNIYYSLNWTMTNDISDPVINEIRLQNISNREENTMLKRQMNLNNTFLGLIYFDDIKFIDLEQPEIKNMFTFDNNLYIYDGKFIYSKKPYSKRMKKIIQINLEPLFLKGQYLYYISEESYLARYNLSSNEHEILVKKPIETAFAIFNDIIFSTYDGIYALKDLTKIEKISNETAKIMSGDENHIYFIRRDSRDLNRMNFRGENITLLRKNVNIFETSYNSDHIIFYGDLENGKYGIDIIKKSTINEKN